VGGVYVDEDEKGAGTIFPDPCGKIFLLMGDLFKTQVVIVWVIDYVGEAGNGKACALKCLGERRQGGAYALSAGIDAVYGWIECSEKGDKGRRSPGSLTEGQGEERSLPSDAVYVGGNLFWIAVASQVVGPEAVYSDEDNIGSGAVLQRLEGSLKSVNLGKPRKGDGKNGCGCDGNEDGGSNVGTLHFLSGRRGLRGR
jgi:hypothetical protein